MFKWICASFVAVFMIVSMLIALQIKSSLDQLLTETKTAVKTTNAQLPTIVDQVGQGTATLVEVSEDIKLLKSVVGINQDDDNSSHSYRGMAVYADEIQKLLQEYADSGANILAKGTVGSDLVVKETLEEFLVGLHKEMPVILATSKSRQEVLYRATRSGILRRHFHIKLANGEPIALEEFIRAQHEVSRNLPVHDKD